MSVFKFPIKHDPDTWLWHLKHALCPQKEIVSEDDGYWLRASQCLKHGEIYVYEEGTTKEEKEDEC